MEKKLTMPNVGDWIPVDSEGHTGKVIAITTPPGGTRATVYVGISDPLCTDVEIPYYASISPKYAASAIGVDSIPADVHMVLAIADTEFDPCTDGVLDGIHLEVGREIPIHKSGCTALITEISDDFITVLAAPQDVSRTLSHVQYYKDASVAPTKYYARFPIAVYRVWYNCLFFFKPGMHIRVGYHQYDIAEVVDVNRRNPYNVTVTTVLKSGAPCPMLLWSANHYDPESRIMKINSVRLYDWVQSTAPDVLPDVVESSTTFTGYSKLVPPAMAHSAAAEIVGVASDINRAVSNNAPLEEQKHHMGRMLYHLMRLINAYGLDPQDVATQSLVDRAD